MPPEGDREARHRKRRRLDDDPSNEERWTSRPNSSSLEGLEGLDRRDRDRAARQHPERRRRLSSIEKDNRMTDSHHDDRKPNHRSRSLDRNYSRDKRRRSVSSDEGDHRRTNKKDGRGEDGNSGRNRNSLDRSHQETKYRRPRRRRSSSSTESGRDKDRRRNGSRDESRNRNYDREKHLRYRSRSPHRERREQSPKRKNRRALRSASPLPRSRKPLPSQDESFHKLLRTGLTPPPIDKPVPKEKPNFNTTGLLARETNLVTGTDIVLKYNEPPEARKPPPSQEWQMFIFKGSDVLSTTELGGKSVWLLGRESKVVDVITAHPSCSGQHAVVQFRHTTKSGKNGEPRPGVRPYLLDLESANGTTLNGQNVEGSRYVELRSGDLVKFGSSEREYVIMLPPKES